MKTKYLNFNLFIGLFIGLLISLSAEAQYGGGAGDGFSMTASTSATLNGLNTTSVYSGGSGDGFDLSASSSSTLAGLNTISIYSGGAGDGFDMGGISSNSLAGLSANSIYGGGAGDGFDISSTSSSSLTGLTTSMVYFGGVGDGFDGVTIMFTALAGPNNSIVMPKTGPGALVEEEQTEEESIVQAEMEAVVFPNPGNGQFQLRIEGLQPAEFTLRVFDLSGRMILTQSLRAGSSYFQGSFDLENISSGVYIIQLQQNDQQMIRKLIVE